MRHFPIRTLGRLLVIWGALLPLITLPSTAFGPYRIIPLLEVSLSRIDARIGPMTEPTRISSSDR